MEKTEMEIEEKSALEEDKEPCSQTEMELSRIRSIVSPVCSWFEREQRQLEWRRNPTPYRVWISEIMLQQTRVEAVKPYFQNFMECLPRLLDLAQVPEEHLLKLWEGLGYYSRARNLKKAALVCMERHNGALPASYEELMALPGIGSYTAGAIASIAFGIPVPAVDGNVLRVVLRVLAVEEEIRSPRAKKLAEQYLKTAIEKEKPIPGQFNQGMMELGATVCLPNGAPRCGECSIRQFCLAQKENRTDSIPRKTSKKDRPVEEKTVFVLWAEGKLLLHKRSARGLLAGLYELPNAEGTMSEANASHFLQEMTGQNVHRIREIGAAKHIFTHLQWNMIGYEGIVSQTVSPGDSWVWVTPDQLNQEYPIAGAFQRYRAFIDASNPLEKRMTEGKESG